MPNTIISNTSCLILLDNIQELDLLQKLFGVITTTSEIVAEYGKPLPGWFAIKDPQDLAYQKVIESSIDKGEASAIALAVETDDCLLIIDDRKERKYAQQLQLKIVGTFGIIIDAKLTGIISSVKPILQKIKQTNFRMDPALEALIIHRAGE